MWYATYDSPIGQLIALKDKDQMVELCIAFSFDEFLNGVQKKYEDAIIEAPDKFLVFFRLLDAYFTRNMKFSSFNGVRKKLVGTDFQLRVWSAIQKIPYGSVVSYCELARKVGRPKSARAVANACGKNPLPIVIPCHRVVGKMGLGGYTGGIWIKKALLEMEGAQIKAKP